MSGGWVVLLVLLAAGAGGVLGWWMTTLRAARQQQTLLTSIKSRDAELEQLRIQLDTSEARLNKFYAELAKTYAGQNLSAAEIVERLRQVKAKGSP